MNSVHDMGGMHGLGAVVVEADEPVFHEPWEARIFAMNLAIGAWGRWNIDAGRHQNERIPGSEYLNASYYQRWLLALSENMIKYGLVTRDEVEKGRSAGGPELTPPLQAAIVEDMNRLGSSKMRDIERQPRYRPGDAVVTRNIHPIGHTRLPRYARDKRGVVLGASWRARISRFQCAVPGGKSTAAVHGQIRGPCVVGRWGQPPRHRLHRSLGGLS